MTRPRRRNVFKEAAHALAAELHDHHAPTAAHSNRIAALTRRLGEALGLDALELTEAEVVAILHDVGKLFVPVELLEKPGPLDPAERAIVEAHAMLGGELLARTAGLEHLEPLVRATHERWDGSGYPDGLSGEAIPLAARIVAAADAYDAMRHARPYRRALDDDEVRARLRAGRGGQFDPRIAGVLLAFA